MLELERPVTPPNVPPAFAAQANPTQAPAPRPMHSAELGQVLAALAKAQGDFGPIHRNKTVKVRMKSGGEYTFSYAPLENLIAATRPALAANGLSVTQLVVADPVNGDMVRTVIYHASGEFLANEIPIITTAGEGGPQAFASAVTYARRYGYTLGLCLASDEDDDGNLASGNTATTVRAPADPQLGAEAGARTAEKPRGRGRAAEPEVISADQLKTLREKMNEAGAVPDAFAQFLGVPSLDKLAPSQLQKALAALEAKIEKNRKAAAADKKADAGQLPIADAEAKP